MPIHPVEELAHNGRGAWRTLYRSSFKHNSKYIFRIFIWKKSNDPGIYFVFTNTNLGSTSLRGNIDIRHIEWCCSSVRYCLAHAVVDDIKIFTLYFNR